jgi:uncharacterized protein (TIGR03792 family)
VVIEKLSILVNPASKMEDFLKLEEKLWTPWLRQQEGFIQKTLDKLPNGRVDVRIFWRSQQDWDNAAKKKSEISVIEARAKNQLGAVYQIL